MVNMKNLVILQGDSQDFNATYSGEYNNSGDSDVRLVLVNLVMLLHMVISVNLVNLLILLNSVKKLIILVNLGGNHVDDPFSSISFDFVHLVVMLTALFNHLFPIGPAHLSC